MSIFRKSIKYNNNNNKRNKYLKDGGSTRFKAFQTFILSSTEKQLDLNIKVILSMIFFDALPVFEIKEALLSVPMVWRDQVCLSWKSHHDKRQQRRVLSVLTLHTLRKTTWSGVQSVNLKNLEKVYAQFSGRKDPLLALALDAMAWFSEVLSGPMSQHVTGIDPMTAVPDSSLVRDQSKQALLKDNISEPLIDIAELGVANSLQGFFEASGNDRNPTLIEEIKTACRKRSNLPNHAVKKLILQDCLKLVPHAANYGPCSSLILAWVIDFVESGTKREHDVSPNTISNYVGLTALKLLHHLKEKDIIDLSAAEFEDIYLTIRDSCTESQQAIASSALASFHFFLEEWFEVEPLKITLNQNLPIHLPNANVVWPHEMEIIFEWLNNAKCDERLIQNWQVSFAISFTCRIRSRELLNLRINNFIEHDGLLEMQIVSSRKDPSLKSNAGKRAVIIEHPVTIEIIKKLIERRRGEHVFEDDLIFGDPYQPKTQYKIGLFYYGLSHLLKLVSGDASLVFHSLSHTVISGKIAEIQTTNHIGEINPYYQIATNAGHYSPQTTLSTYSHLYELPLRKELDVAMSDIKITSGFASTFTGQHDSALRQKVSRNPAFNSKESKNRVYWDAIFKSKVTDEFSCVTSLTKTVVPDPPAFLQNSNSVGFVTILNLLEDVANGFSLASVASRSGRDQVWVENVVEVMRQLCIRYRLWRGVIQHDSSLNEFSSFVKNLTCSKYGVDFTKTNQVKFMSVYLYLASQKDSAIYNLKDYFECWVKSTKYPNYLEINDSSTTLKLLKFLNEAGVKSINLSVFIAVKDQYQQAEGFQDRLLAIRKLFSPVFKFSPSISYVAARGGRPANYLGWTESRVLSQITPSPAATSITGFSALMLALGVWLNLGDRK